MPDPPGQTYPKEQARQLFQRATRKGSVIFTKHASERMAERGLDTNDILTLARTGSIYNEPEPHGKTGEWTYRIECQNPRIKGVFTILSEQTVCLITVIVD